MQPKQDTYPVFEANQVLTSRHLNQVFDYLDEQERLTRANLVGIGIVCGLEIRLTAGNASVLLSKGCGVTSEGYLIVEPEEEVALVEYKKYVLPDEVTEYLPFKYETPDPNDNTKIIRLQYDLWELLEQDEPGSTKLTSGSGKFLEDKAVLLFLELKQDGLRNCSPNNCDDKGSEVTATVRRLLVRIADLTKIIAAANKQGTALTPADLESVLLARLSLPDIRLPRYNVPNTEPATSEDVYSGFFDVFHDSGVAKATGSALSNAYQAFLPLLEDEFPADPFLNVFSTKFGFLDAAPTSVEQVRFLQYYYDLFDDLLKAYDEFRWKGAELMCACCPPNGLFPRHLMLGLLHPAQVQQPAIFRHPFLASSAISGCEEHTEDVRLLFRRLVEMVRSFSEAPVIPIYKIKNKKIAQIRITPSKLADVPLSDKAIPYYYEQDGKPPLFHLWNAQHTRRGRANQNLSYRSYQYAPAPPAFVSEPLQYDLEPYNFFRIEGHLNQNYQDALEALLQMKKTFRLPIEVVALRTGAFDQNIAVDLGGANCRFQDLETLYDVTREEWFCFLAKEMAYFYGSTTEVPKTKSQFELLVKYAPGFLVSPNTLGATFEDYIKEVGGIVADLTGYTDLFVDFIKTSAPNDGYVYYFFFYILKIHEVLKADIKDFDLAKLNKQFNGLSKVAAAQEKRREDGTTSSSPEGSANILKWEEFDDRVEDILNTCVPETFKAIKDEYARRIIEVKQKQFLSFFLQNNPGIQHKAGVPVGGTFILVYHDDIEPVIKDDIDRPATDVNVIQAVTRPTVVATVKAKDAVATRVMGLSSLSENDKQVIFTALGTKDAERTVAAQRGNPIDAAIESIISDTVEGLSDGTVIADFFLPYLCRSDYSSVQFTLPAIPPTFTFEVGCTGANSKAEVTFTPAGGVAPYSIKVGGDDFVPLASGKMLLFAGDNVVTIRDSAGIQTLPQKVTVRGVLAFGAETYECDANLQFVVKCTMLGGRAPFTSPQGSFSGAEFTSTPALNGKSVTVEVTDGAGCTASKRFTYTCVPPCTLPCGGEVVRCNYRFWIPVGSQAVDTGTAVVQADRFTFRGPDGVDFDLTGQVRDIVSKFDQIAFDKNFPAEVKKMWIDPLNKLIAEQTKDDKWLRLEYVPNDKDQFGLLRIERFNCLPFVFQFAVNYKLPTAQGIPQIVERYMISYSSDEGYRMAVPQSHFAPVTVPPMNCETLNRCKNEKTWQPVCPSVPFKEVNIVEKKIVQAGVLRLGATTSGETQAVAFVWEVPQAKPSLINGATATMVLNPPNPKVINIRVTAFAKNGCSVTVETTIQQAEGPK